MYVILETAWADVDCFFPQLIIDDDGNVLKFETEAEAKRYAKTLQKGQVVKIE